MKIILMCSANRGVRAARALAEMLESGDELALFTFKESPWEPPFVSDLQGIASEFQLPFHVTTNVEKAKYHEFISRFQPDLVFLIGWRYLVSEKTYSPARIGAFVFHDSLLPAYRGFAPTVWAMVNMLGSALLFSESLTPMKVLGTFIIVIGLVVLSRGY